MNPFDPYNPQDTNHPDNNPNYNPGNNLNNNPNYNPGNDLNSNPNYNPGNDLNYNPNYDPGNIPNNQGQELNPFARQSGGIPWQGMPQSTPTFGNAGGYTPLNQYDSYADYNPYAGMDLPVSEGEAGGSAKTGTEGKKKSKLGLILGITAGVVAVAALLVLWLGGFLHSKSGKYVWDDYQVFGMMVELSIDGSEGEIKITADGKEQTQKCSVEFYEDKVELTMNGKYLICNYDRKRQTITVPDDTYLKGDIVLEKD